MALERIDHSESVLQIPPTISMPINLIHRELISVKHAQYNIIIDRKLKTSNSDAPYPEKLSLINQTVPEVYAEAILSDLLSSEDGVVDLSQARESLEERYGDKFCESTFNKYALLIETYTQNLLAIKLSIKARTKQTGFNFSIDSYVDDSAN